jgi:preprotein translocase SecE subunit
MLIIMWRRGALKRLGDYVMETREELRKCSWPGVDELKGSTVVVLISILLLGAFTVGIDFVLTMVFRFMSTQTV